MKIAVIDTTIDGEVIGGAQTFLPNLIQGLTKAGNEVHLIIDGVPNAKVLPEINKTGCFVHTDVFPSHLLVEDKTVILARWLNNLSPDIYVVSVSPDVGWTVLPHLKPEIATFMIGHSDTNAFYNPLKHYSNYINRGIGVSVEVCKMYEDYCGLPPEKIQWIPYGIKPSETKPEAFEAGKPLQLVYVGRLEEFQKRVSDLIKIAKSLNDRNTNYSLTIIGDGPSMPGLKQGLTEEVEKGKVKLLGWLKNDDLLAQLRQSEVSLLVSDSEGFCIALIEEIANGCCPVVTDIKSGNKQMVADGENGFIVPVGDIEGFAEKIEFLANNPAKLLEFRQKAWETGKNYSIDRMVENYEACFAEAVNEAKTKPRKVDPNFPLMESCRSKYPTWLRRIKAKTKQLVSAG